MPTDVCFTKEALFIKKILVQSILGIKKVGIFALLTMTTQ